MDYARSQRNAKKNLIGFTGVVLLHAFIIYALMSGLASKTLKVLVKPLETKIIEEIKPPPPPPPPPPKKAEPPPKAAAPPPPFVPPPEVVVAAPAAPVISTVSVTPPIVEPVIAPPAPPAPVQVIAPPAPPPPPPPPKPKVRTDAKATFTEECIYPRAARRDNIVGGEFVTLLNVDEKGNVTNVDVLQGRRTDGFDREIKRCLALFKYPGEGEKYQVRKIVEFKLVD